LAGEVFLVTAGPTEEPLDPVRVLTNRSSGRMGFAIAEEAARRGAEVVLVAGPVSLSTPPGVDRIDVQTATQMHDGVLQALGRATVVVKTAAVADYRPETSEGQKIKRDAEDRTIRLVPNPDILVEVVRRKGSRTVVGFAAETENVLEYAKGKLERKGCDLIVANDVSRADIGFDVDRNEVWIVGPTPSEVVHVPPATKREVAARILDRIREVRRA
jgi:phosphopantothenoylcysteine decarboxylase/phosphopantothenate--cysteine ligase